MSQAQVDKEPARKCAYCIRIKPEWDKHTLCKVCRECNQKSPCDVCKDWDQELWAKWARAIKEYNKKQRESESTTSGAERDKEMASETSDGDAGPTPPTQQPEFVRAEDLKAILNSMIDSQAAFMQEVRSQIKHPAEPPSVSAKNKGPSKSSKGKTVPSKQEATKQKQAKELEKLASQLLDGDEDIDLSPGSPYEEDMVTDEVSLHTESDLSEEDTDVTKIPSNPKGVHINEEEGEGTEEPLITDDTAIQIMTSKGPVSIPFKMEHEMPAIAFPDRIALVAALIGIEPIAVKPDTDLGLQVDINKPEAEADTEADDGSDSLVLPVSKNVTRTVNNFIQPLRKTTSTRAQPFLRPPKRSFACSTEPSFYDLTLPSKAFNNLTKVKMVPTIPNKQNKPFVSPGTLTDLASVSRDMLATSSSLLYISQALAQLRAVQYHPRQNKQGLEVVALALQDLQSLTMRQLLRGQGYMEAAITLTRRDLYLHNLTYTAAQDHRRDLRHADWTAEPNTLFGNKEEAAAAEYQASLEAKASQAQVDRSRKRQRDFQQPQGQQKRARSSSRPRGDRSVQFREAPTFTVTNSYDNSYEHPRGRGRGGGRGRGKSFSGQDSNQPFYKARGGKKGGSSRGRGRGSQE